MSNASILYKECSHGYIQTSCADCNLRGLCLPIAMDIKDIDHLDKIINRNKPVQKGEFIYRSGEPFTSIYAVRSGSIKTYLIDDNGVEQITGFYLPGEVLGFDGIAAKQHACNVIALETSSLCEIPFHQLEALSLKVPALQRQFFTLMSRQIESNHQMMLTLSKKNAKSKVSTLLLSLSKRYSRRNLSGKVIYLPMSRTDMANFLGLTIETISRTFSNLRANGTIDIDGRELVIKNYDELSALCHAQD